MSTTVIASHATGTRPRIPATASAVLLVWAVQIAVAIHRTRDSYFVTDDFLNFIIFRNSGLTWSYLFRDIFGHIIPLYRLIQGVVLTVNGVHFQALRATMIALALLPTGLLVLMGNRLGVPLQVSGASALLMAVLPQIGQTEIWWSNGLLVLPGLAAIFAVLWLLVGKLGRGPSHAESAMAGFVFAVGLGFYDKDLFAPVMFLGVSTALHVRRLGLVPAVLRAFFDLRYIIAVAVVWVVVIAVLRDPSPPPPTFAVAARFVWLAWRDATVAPMLGINGSALGSGPLMLASFTSVAVIAAGAVVLRLAGRGRCDKGAIFIWIGIAVYFIVTTAVTARMRAGAFGAEMGRLLRYAVEPAAFIAAGIAMTSRWYKRPWLAAFAIVAVAINVLAVSEVPLSGDPVGTRAYVRNLRGSFAHIRGTRDVTILDAPVPERIMPRWMGPLNVQSQFLPMVGIPHYDVSPLPNATWFIDPNGEVEKRH